MTDLTCRAALAELVAAQDHFDSLATGISMAILLTAKNRLDAAWAAARSALAQEAVQAEAEFTRDTDGELLIDWSPAAGRMVTLSLRDDGRLSYAITWDGEKSHGQEQMPPRSPQPKDTKDHP